MTPVRTPLYCDYASVNSSSTHPPNPPGNHGAFAHVVRPSGGAFTILSWPGGWALAFHGATPGHFHTRAFKSAMEEFIGKDQAFVEDWLVHQGLEKLVEVFKGMFSQFLIFLHYL